MAVITTTSLIKLMRLTWTMY